MIFYYPSNIIHLIYKYCTKQDKYYMKYFFQKNKLYFDASAIIDYNPEIYIYYNVMKERYSVIDYNKNDHLYRPIIRQIYKKFDNDMNKKKTIEIYKLIKHVNKRININNIFEILIQMSDIKYCEYFMKYREYYMGYNNLLITLKNKKNDILKQSTCDIIVQELCNVYKPIPGDIEAKIVVLDIRFLRILGNIQ